MRRFGLRRGTAALRRSAAVVQEARRIGPARALAAAARPVPCPRCGAPVRRYDPCGACGFGRRLSALEWVESSGRGTLYSWTVVVHPVAPVLVEQVPYVVALVELEEGVRMIGNITGREPDELEAGLPLEVYFEERDDGLRLPTFRAAS